MADSKGWKSALTPQKAPTYGNQAMFITCPKELEVLNADYIVVFDGTKKYHVTNAKIINPYTLHVIIPEHDIAEEVNVEVYQCQNNSSNVLTTLKFTYISQMEHAIAKFLAQSVSDPEVSEKLDAVWMVCLGKDHLDLWDKRLAQAFSQLELPLDWTLVGDVLQSDTEFQPTLLHFAAHHGLKELIKVFLERPGAKLALSKCDKFGLLPRDVARENGKLDLVDLLDSERFDEKHKCASHKDSGLCQVVQNNDNGVATISNGQNHNKQDDIDLLHELNKLAQTKNGSPVYRHSWPIKVQSFNADTFLENLENNFNKSISHGETKSSVKRTFLDENLICLRDVTEELCQLRSENSQTTSKEISIIADRNRRPMHSRRLSCPASVSQRKKNNMARESAQTPTQSSKPKIEVHKSPSNEQIFSTPPHSPVIGQLIDIDSTVAITPPSDEPVPSPEKCIDQQELQPFTDQSQEPTSPMPISYKFENVERRTNARKERPNTWYGGPAGNNPEEEVLRRSNSLEDFANKLALNDDSDNESETQSKEDLLQTISSIVDRVDRKESFLSSISDLSVGKDSVASDNEGDRESDSEEEKDRDSKRKEQECCLEQKGPDEEVEKEGVEDDKRVLHEEVTEHGDYKERQEQDDLEGHNEESGEVLHQEQNKDEMSEEKNIHEERKEKEPERDEKEDELEELEKKSDPEGLKEGEVYEEHEGLCKDEDDKEDKHKDENKHEVHVDSDSERKLEDKVDDEEHGLDDEQNKKYKENKESDEPKVVQEPEETQEPDASGEETELVEHGEDDEELKVNEEQYKEAEAHVEYSEAAEERKEPGETDEYSEIQGIPQDQGENGEVESKRNIPEYIGPVLEENEVLENKSLINTDQYLSKEESVPQKELDHNQERIEEEPENLLDDEGKSTDTKFEKNLVQIDDISENHVAEQLEKGNEKHIRFNEIVSQSKSPSTPTVEDLPQQTDQKYSGKADSFRNRSGAIQTSAILLTLTKAPVKRTGSDVSVTSLQDAQFNMDPSARTNDLSLQSNLARKTKSYGDLSSFRDAAVHMKDEESDEDTLEEERRRIQQDQQQLSVQKRIKKFEHRSKFGSNEKLNQIGTSRIHYEGDDGEPGKRRWTLFNAKNPKPEKKKSGRTPFRRDTLRSSMSGIMVGKSSGKKTIESLVQNQPVLFAKHSATAPNASNAVGRPRSWTRESPSSVRKFSPVVAEGEEAKPSTESPDDAPAEEVNDVLDLEVDPDLENFDREPETWCETVDKRTVSKMGKKEIKRQDIIMELIKTEHHHMRTLKIMQQVFYRGLNKWANYPWEKLDQLFPRINELVELSVRFHRNLQCRQNEEAVVSRVGDIIVKHFSDETGEAIKDTYGEFVSKHQEGVALYKHYFKTDKKFANFIKKCHGHRIVRRLSIPECFTLVTQRLTKYPPLIEALMKVTKSSSAEHKQLQRSLVLVKEALQAVDNAIKDYEKQTKLKDIKTRMEKGSVVLKNSVKIKNSRFVDYPSKMISDGMLNWRSARGKLTETHVVLLESMVAFLQENDKKFSLLSIDGKAPCIALKTLMVREVATDKNAIYFVSTSTNERREPEMYEFVCSNHKEKKQWMATLSDAISKAPDDIGDLFQSPEEERKLAEERLQRRNEILEIMKTKDQELSRWIEEKNSLCTEMKELLSAPNGNGKAKEEEKVLTSSKVRDILSAAIRRTTQLTADSIQHLHESHSDSELAAAASDEKASAPKRAETFGGFDRRPSTKASRRQTSTISEGTVEVNHVSQRRDSGCSTTSLASESVSSALNVLNQGQDWGPGSFLQILEALQWVLNQFNQKETALENLRNELHAALDEVQELHLLRQNDEKKQLLIKEEHQAEIARQKKAHTELERTLNKKIERVTDDYKHQLDNYQQLENNFERLSQMVMNR